MIQLLLLFTLPAFVQARVSPLGYYSILALVLLELLFAFCIALSCILISIHLFQKVSTESELSQISAANNRDLSKPSYSALFLENETPSSTTTVSVKNQTQSRPGVLQRVTGWFNSFW